MVPASKPALPQTGGKWRLALPFARPEVALPSFDEIYEQHFEFISRSVRGLGAHPAFVEDLTQDVFVIAHRKLDTYEGAGSLRGWLFGIARRVCRDHRRSAQRKGAHVDLDEQQSSQADDPHRQAASRQALALVERFAEALDEERRGIFFLALVEGLPVSEVAETLGLNPNTTYSRVRVLRRDLAELLETTHHDTGGPDGSP